MPPLSCRSVEAGSVTARGRAIATTAAARQTSETFAVGVPKAERIVTAAAVHSAKSLLAPGRGRQLLVLEEVDLGVGRPDVILLAVSRQAVKHRIASGLRVRTLAEAEVLAAAIDGRASRHTRGFERATIARFRSTGWCPDAIARLPAAVNDSLLLEAKVADWRSGVAQISRARWATQLAALVMPASVAHRPATIALDRNSMGLVTVDERAGTAAWSRPSPRRPVSTVASLWLAELAARAIGDATL